MVAITPLPLRLVDDAWADRVPSPAHDSLTPDQRRATLVANPDSYLAITRSVEDLGPPSDEAGPVGSDTLLELSRASLDRLLDRGAFGGVRPDRFYVYQLEARGHVQTGVVGGVSTAAFAHGDVRVHEQVHHERAAHLARHLAVVGVQSSPIALAHLRLPAVVDIIDDTMGSTPPVLEVRSEPGFVQRVWPVDPDRSAELVTLFSPEPLYLIDGHHRGAAAVEHRRLVGPGTADHVLCALFPVDQLTNFAFHRVLPGRIGRHSTVESFARRHDLRRLDRRPRPEELAATEVALFDGAAGGWSGMEAPTVANLAPALRDLAPSRLAHQFDMAFGDAWHDVVAYRPGVLPLDRIVAETAERSDVLFVLEPISLDQLIAVADKGLTMPPKSTYFDPKVRSGLFLRHL